jgi:endonuclease/exonuclease/phosphatase (EEP) superfamily protein YafD
MIRFFFAAGALCFTAASGAGQIVLDGRFDDWNGIPVTDAPAGSPLLKSMRATVTEDRLVLRLDLHAEVALDETILPNALKLLIDTDANPSTGANYANSGLGIDVLIDWADRQVIRYAGTGGSGSLNAIGTLASPTYSGDRFEISIDRALLGLPGSVCRIAWHDATGGTLMPAGGLPVGLTALPFAHAPVPLERAPGTAVRAVFWNANTRIGQPAAEAAMQRILQATAPDVVALSEVSDNTPAQVAALLNAWLPGTPAWTVVKDDYDLMVATRLPVLSTHPAINRQFPVVLDAGTTAFGGPILLVSSHLKCCGGTSNEATRQAQADEFMAFLRNSRTPGNSPSLPATTPVLYGGDLNLVGLAQPMRTLTTGDLVNNATYGPDFAPDADGTAFTELPLTLSDFPADYTWENASGQFIPGKLDIVVVSDATVQPLRGFALHTGRMSSERLSQWGLLAGDTEAASDHVPVVVDVAPTGPVPPAGTGNYGGPDSDGDGLSDALEVSVFGTNPFAADSDGDGVSDPLELCDGPTPCLGDLNSDAVVSIADLLLLLGTFGAPC